MNRIRIAVATAALIAAASSASAQDAATPEPHTLGQHPAVIVAARGAAGYDYASKFYLHPAGLALSGVAPHELGEHPAVQVAEGHGRQGLDPNTFIVGHPASPTTRGDTSHGLSLAGGAAQAGAVAQ